MPPAEAAPFEVWPENWPTIEVFLELSTCWLWVTPGMEDPVRVGIAATEIESSLRLLGVKKAKRCSMFRDLRAMERAALKVFRSSA